jgi:hypothetical protein
LTHSFKRPAGKHIPSEGHQEIVILAFRRPSGYIDTFLQEASRKNTFLQEAIRIY